MTNLLALLLSSRRFLTFDEIRSELKGQYPDNIVAARAAFERDKALLRDEGIPIDSEILGGDKAGTTGYRIQRSAYELGDLGLTPEETRALRVAVATLRLGQTWGEEALWKVDLADVESEPVTTSVHATWAGDDRVPLIHEAISRRRSISFEYHQRSRRVNPFGLLAQSGWWYLVGLDEDAGALRTFRIDRIDGAVLAGDANSFERPSDFVIQSAFPRDPKELPGSVDVGTATALVRFEATDARPVLAELGEESLIRRHDDGSIEVAVPCANVVAFTHWLLGFMDRAEVLEPPALRNYVVEWLESMVQVGHRG